MVFAIRSSSEVFGSASNAVQFLEPDLCVFLLVLGSLQEQGCDLFEPILFRLRCKIRIFVAGLGFSGKRGFQVLLSLRTDIRIRFYNFGLNLYELRSGLLADLIAVSGGYSSLRWPGFLLWWPLVAERRL